MLERKGERKEGKKGRKEGRREGGKERRREGRKEGRREEGKGKILKNKVKKSVFCMKSQEIFSEASFFVSRRGF
jgi:hypothetical protein